MTTPIVTMATAASCPHSIPITIAATGVKVLILGSVVAVNGDKGLVAGCPFTTPDGKPQPCVKADFLRASSKVQSGGVPVLLINPSDICKSGEIPNGPVIWTTPQTKVIAT